MGFKFLIGVLVVLLVVGGYGIGASEKVSLKIEEYANEKLEEPQIEKFAYFNINYMDFTGKAPHEEVPALFESFPTSDNPILMTSVIDTNAAEFLPEAEPEQSLYLHQDPKSIRCVAKYDVPGGFAYMDYPYDSFSTNVAEEVTYRTNRVFEPIEFNVDEPSLFQIREAVDKLTTVVGPFDVQTISATAVEYEGVSWGQGSFAQAWSTEARRARS